MKLTDYCKRLSVAKAYSKERKSTDESSERRIVNRLVKNEDIQG